MTVNPAYLRTTTSLAPEPVPIGASSTLSITPVPHNDQESPSQRGILLLYRDARHGREADIITLDFPRIVLTKTVGLSPGGCATTKAITLTTASATVYYCYTVQNTGNITLSTHTLTDTALGGLLNGFSHNLAPGATIFVTASATLTQTTENTAEWTAFASGGNFPAYDSDSARVVIYTPTLTTLALTATPSTLFANGISTTTVVATLLDQLNVPVTGQSVTLLANQGTLSANAGTSDASGRVTVTLTAPPTAGVGTIFAIAGPLSATRQVTFVQQVTGTANFSLSTLAQSTSTVQTGGVITYTFTVTNSGPGNATGVLMFAPVPSGTSYVVGSASGGIPFGGSLMALLSGETTFAPEAGSSSVTAIVWQGDIPANASHAISYAVKANLVVGVITNTSRVYLNNQLVGAHTQVATVEPKARAIVPIARKA
ncbi:MAG: Ig-like domain-containing protein [Thermoflexales bacterium]|nr:Ig-like domain-containing protein [Thermoflexales bacterium]